VQLGKVAQEIIKNKKEEKVGEEVKKSKSPVIWIILILVLVVAGIGVGAWLMLRGDDTDPVTDEVQRIIDQEEREERTREPGDAQTGVEMDFEKTTAVDPIQGKSEDAYDLMMPKLESVFPEGVKLRRTSTTNSTYIVNRVLESNDTAALREEFEADGFTTEDMDDTNLNVRKGQEIRLRISLYNLDDPNRAEISVYHR